MEIVIKIFRLVILVGALSLLQSSCSAPNTEEIRLVEGELHLAILPFKIAGKYVAFDLHAHPELSKTVIKGIKSPKDLDNLPKEWNYLLIESIEKFDENYSPGHLYFIIVKRFIDNRNQKNKYIFISNVQL